MPPPQRPQGLALKQVKVDQVVRDRGLAICVEVSTGTYVEVPLTPMRGRAGTPRVGETWIIDRSLGVWTFSSIVGGTKPQVTGARAAADPVTLSLLAALVDLGLVEDATT